MIAIRAAKVALVAAIALFASLVAFGNLTDYDTNFVFVQHVLSMDTIYPSSTINVPGDHQSRTAPRRLRRSSSRRKRPRPCCVGSARSCSCVTSAPGRPYSIESKALAIVGLTLGFLVWQVGFMSIGGEWFGMWQSQQWNGVPSAFRFLMTIIAVLIFVAMPDQDLDRREGPEAGPVAVAGKSTLNRLELSRPEPTRYHKIAYDPAAIESLFVTLFLEAHKIAPKEIILDLDATDDPVHGEQEGRFFRGYYDCYCYLPLYVFCGRHLLAAKLRSAGVDAAAGAVEDVARLVAPIRRCWPNVRILLRADSGFAREELMVWCEANGVHFLFGLAQNRASER